jgi:hypothetical protein
MGLWPLLYPAPMELVLLIQDSYIYTNDTKEGVCLARPLMKRSFLTEIMCQWHHILSSE